MKKRAFVFIVLSAWGLLLGGNFHKKINIRPVVTSIEIYTGSREVLYHKLISDQKKMSMLLGYLRATDTPFPAKKFPTDPMQPIHKIRVNLSDGTTHLYEQLGCCYFRKDGTQWKTIDEDQGKKLETMEKFLFSNSI